LAEARLDTQNQEGKTSLSIASKDIQGFIDRQLTIKEKAMQAIKNRNSHTHSANTEKVSSGEFPPPSLRQ
jgi:hypothetical protein